MPVPAPVSVPVSDSRAIALFLDMLAAERGAAENTLLAYRRDLEQASEQLDGRLAGAAVGDVERLFTNWADLAPASLQRKRATLRRFFSFLVTEAIREDSPASGIAAPAGGRRLPKTLSADQVAQILGILTEEAATGAPNALRLQALVELLYGSGLRATELVSLPRHAIRPPEPFAIICGKGGKERMVPLSAAALAAVTRHMEHVPAESRWLFPSRKGHLSRIRLYQLVQELAARAGINPAQISPHVLRHAFATHMLAGGADLRSLQMLLGHADISTTEIYTHVDSSRLAKTVNRLHPLADEGRSG